MAKQDSSKIHFVSCFIFVMDFRNTSTATCSVSPGKHHPVVTRKLNLKATEIILTAGPAVPACDGNLNQPFE